MLDLLSTPLVSVTEDESSSPSECKFFITRGSMKFNSSKCYLVVPCGSSTTVKIKKNETYLAIEVSESIYNELSRADFNIYNLFTSTQDTVYFCYENIKTNQVYRVSSYYKLDIPTRLLTILSGIETK